MTGAMAVFPTLAEPITVPASKLTAEARSQAGLDAEVSAVLEPANDGVRVRAASVDEQLAYEQSMAWGMSPTRWMSSSPSSSTMTTPGADV